MRDPKNNTAIVFGLCVVGLVTLLAIIGPTIAPFDFDQMRKDEQLFGALQSPNSLNLLGTSSEGFDVLSRVILGAKAAIIVAGLSILASGLIGITLGAIAGFFGGVLDRALSLVADALYSLPSLLIAIVISLTLASSTNAYWAPILAAVIAEATSFSAKYFRVVRSEVAITSSSRFVEAAKASGVGRLRIVFVHVLPNSLKSVPALFAQNAADGILTLAGLGFLGIGISSNAGAEWGYDLNRALSDLSSGIWWTTVFPGIAIAVTVVGFTFLGEGLNEKFDPEISFAVESRK
jgi:peptide/nickel transport system permease protein